MNGEAAGKVPDLSEVETIADLRIKLQKAQAETKRTSMQRDYALRLLRQQQTASAAKGPDEAFALLMERSSFSIRAMKFVQRRFTHKIPSRIKRFLKRVIVKIG